MPPKRGGKKGQSVKKLGAGSKKAAAAGSSGRQATSSKKESSEEKSVPLAKATPQAQQPVPEAGTKRAEPETSAIDLEATLQRRQKLAEELQGVEKQVRRRT